MNRNVIVLLNTASGSIDAKMREKLPSMLTELFEAENIVAELIFIDRPETLNYEVKEAIRRNPAAIIAGGGDGTINTVASQLVNRQIALGIIPAGTLNHFAKDLEIPIAIDGALRTVVDGKVVRIDVGEVNGKYFFNNSSIGLYPKIVTERKKIQRLGHSKWPAFFWALVQAFRRYPVLSARLNVDGEESTRRSPFFFIGNNRYKVEGFDVGARERLDSGKICLYMSHRAGRWDLIRFAFSALVGRLSQQGDFEEVCAEEITVETKHRFLTVATDGELKNLETPLCYRILPGALNVIVPRDSHYEEVVE